jgi:hypothetical protein
MAANATQITLRLNGKTNLRDLLSINAKIVVAWALRMKLKWY